MNFAYLHLLMIGAMALIVGLVVEIAGRRHRRKRRREALDGQQSLPLGSTPFECPKPIAL